VLEQEEYRWDVVGYAVYEDASASVSTELDELSAGDTAWIAVEIANTGRLKWVPAKGANVVLCTYRPPDHPSALALPNWVSPSRPVAVDQVVEQGKHCVLEFGIRVPTSGSTREHFNLLAEGVSWFHDPGFALQVGPSNKFASS
jgi:hypothetical protein